MSNIIISNFNDLNNFCDTAIYETEKWRNALQIQTEEHTGLVCANEYACAKLCKIHHKITFLSFLQDKMQRDLCESESNYNAMLKRVEELECKMVENENCDKTPHYAVYENVECLNYCLNNLEALIENANAHFGNEEAETEKDSEPSCVMIISKQLELLERLERKMYSLSNEVQWIEEFRNRVIHEIIEKLNGTNY